MKQGTIYKVTNIINNKSYIGQTTRFNRRKMEHIRSSNKSIYKDYNWPFHKAIRKYGDTNFVWDIIYSGSCNSDLLNELEMLFIDLYETYKKGYNANYGGGSNRGCIRSEETKKKLSEINKGKKLSSETIKKIVLKTTGKKRSIEFKLNLSRLHKGKSISEDARKKMSLSKIGKKRSPESIEKTRQGNKGKNNYRYDHTIYKFYHSIYGYNIMTRREFIEKHNFHHGKVGDLITGKRKTHKGWKLINNTKIQNVA